MDAWRYGIYLLVFTFDISLVRCPQSFDRYRCEHSKINSISPRDHVLFSIYLCIFLYNNILFHIYIQRKSYKNCRKLEKKQQNYSSHNSFKKRLKNKQKNKQTDNLNGTVKVLNLLIYRALPTVHFHRIVHSFKEGRFLKVSKELWSFAICLSVSTVR